MKPSCATPQPSAAQTPQFEQGLVQLKPHSGWGGPWGHPQRCQGVTACLAPQPCAGKEGGTPSLQARQELGAAPKFCINPTGWCWWPWPAELLYLMGHFEGTMSPVAELGRTMGAGRLGGQAEGPRAPRPAGNPFIFHCCTETNTSSCLFPGRLYFGGWRWLPHAGGLTPAVPAGPVPPSLLARRWPRAGPRFPRPR